MRAERAARAAAAANQSIPAASQSMGATPPAPQPPAPTPVIGIPTAGAVPSGQRAGAATGEEHSSASARTVSSRASRCRA